MTTDRRVPPGCEAMASAEDAKKSAKPEASAAVQAFNQDISRFVKQSSGRMGDVVVDSFAKQQDPFVLIAFADAFGDF